MDMNNITYTTNPYYVSGKTITLNIGNGGANTISGTSNSISYNFFIDCSNKPDQNKSKY
jgi:hypothetical protein